MNFPSAYIYADFEFGNSTGKYPSLIWGSFLVDGVMSNFDLRSEVERARLIAFLQGHANRGLVAYALDAEIRSFHSLFQSLHNPFKYGICLRREHLLLANRCRKLVTGEMISKTSKITVRFNAKSEDKHTKYVNLLNALWKFLGIFNTTHAAYKDRLRDICIRNDPQEVAENIKSIGKYCAMDVQHLPALHHAMMKELETRQGNVNMEQVYFRGKYADSVARKTTRGYSVDNARLVNLCANKGRVTGEIREHIRQNWQSLPTFRFDKSSASYKFQDDTVRDYIRLRCPSSVRRVFGVTKGGKISLDKKHFEQLYPNRHSLDPDDYLQQVYRWKYTSSALRGITLSKRKNDTETKKMGDYIDSLGDGLVRPFHNDYGSQSGRSQPSANGFILLKPAWLRILLTPPPGYCLIVSDYGKEEVLIAAIFSGDPNLLEAYASGDPYTHDGLKCGYLTESMRGTPEWDITRQMLKQKILSTLYRITRVGLALQLSNITKRQVSEVEAERHILTFNKSYPLVNRYFQNELLNYRRNKSITLADGWTMWGDNFKPRSIQNMRIQGTGAVIMRYADVMMEQEGLWVPLTLHDAFYTYSELLPNGDVNYEDCAKMVRCMRKGFSMGMEYRPGHDLITQDFAIVGPTMSQKKRPPQISVDGRVYDLEYKNQYIDKRATKDIEQFSKYFEFTDVGN